MIAQNLEYVKARIAESAAAAGRDPDTVRLVVVSKEVPVEKIIQAHEAGADLFGENRVQEARDKIARLGRDGIHWHFIGHLQKNKVKYIFDLFDLIHSVDSAELGEVIHRQSLQRSRITPILIQVNVSGEAAKFGVDPDRLEATLRAVSKMEGVRVKGLMTIPPFDPDPEKSRRYFSRLRELRDRLSRLEIERIALDELSMGMSSDFQVAVEEGATLVRVGTAVFGPRPPVPMRNR